MTTTITVSDMVKIQSPFVREYIDGQYVVTDKITENFEWCFDNPNTIVSEKLDGTSCAVYILEGAVLGVWNRKSFIPFINKGKSNIITGVQEAYERKYLSPYIGEVHGECVGPKIQGNKYKLVKPLFVPFDRLRKNYAYHSWKKYDHDFDSIRSWFKEGLVPLFRRKNESDFVEGIIFSLETNEGIKYAKLRTDMYDFYKGRRHEGQRKDINNEVSKGDN